MTSPAPTLARPPAVAPPRPAAPAGAASADAPPDDLKWLKRLTWLYIALWLGEGALRKWIVPGLANPLLIIRDPVLLAMFYLAASKGLFPKTKLVAATVVMGLIALLVSFAATSTPLVILAYGLRASYIHLLLIFLLPNIFDRDDVRLVGKWLLLAAGPMAFLVMLQFVANKNSWLNAGAGGATNVMLDAAYGRIRPSGTFSFTNGLTGFTALCSAFFLYHLLEKKVYPRLLWLAAAPAVLVLIVLSGSRTAAGMVFLIVATVGFISVVQRRYRAAAVKLGALAAVIFVGVGSFAVFKQGLDVFAYRFGNAANVQQGFVGRFYESYFHVPFLVAEQAPSFGFGLGMGTNVASRYLTGRMGDILSEGELGRNIMESGPLVGGLYIGLRAVMVVWMGTVALKALRRDTNPLPLMLYSGCFLDLLQGQFAQPTELGYATIASGLVLAAIRPGKQLTPAMDDADPAPAIPARPGATPVLKAAPVVSRAAPPPPAARGRSSYAERLHATTAPEPEPAPKTPGNGSEPPI